MLVTGATGMVGYHVVRRAVESGYEVRALVRATSSISELESMGVECIIADLASPETLPSLKGVDFVVHAAAKVGDWGPAEVYRAVNVVALEHLLANAVYEGCLRRWIQISTLGVYQARHHYGTDETEAMDLGGLDGYTRTKAEAEIVVSRFVDRHRVPAVILRPGFIYGLGDRHLLPRIVDRLRAGKMRLVGSGQRVLNNTYVGNLADSVMLALTSDAAIGEIFNIRDERLVTREHFVGKIADHLGCDRPKHVRMGAARLATAVVERVALMRNRKTAPILTRARMKFLTLDLDFSIKKAREVLAYAPSMDFDEGIAIALDPYTRSA